MTKAAARRRWHGAVSSAAGGAAGLWMARSVVAASVSSTSMRLLSDAAQAQGAGSRRRCHRRRLHPGHAVRARRSVLALGARQGASIKRPTHGAAVSHARVRAETGGAATLAGETLTHARAMSILAFCVSSAVAQWPALAVGAAAAASFV